VSFDTHKSHIKKKNVDPCMTLKVLTSAINVDWLKTLFCNFHTSARDTTNLRLPFVPIPISTHPSVQYCKHVCIYMYSMLGLLYQYWYFSLFNNTPYYNILINLGHNHLPSDKKAAVWKYLGLTAYGTGTCPPFIRNPPLKKESRGAGRGLLYSVILTPDLSNFCTC
jgi:hypothetical protein